MTVIVAAFSSLKDWNEKIALLTDSYRFKSDLYYRTCRNLTFLMWFRYTRFWPALRPLISCYLLCFQIKYFLGKCHWKGSNRIGNLKRDPTPFPKRPGQHRVVFPLNSFGSGHPRMDLNNESVNFCSLGTSSSDFLLCTVISPLLRKKTLLLTMMYGYFGRPRRTSSLVTKPHSHIAVSTFILVL